MLYCYFISRPLPEIEGISYRTLHGAPVEFLTQQNLMAAVRPLASPARSTLPLMLEHNAVIASASKKASILPLPFGSIFRGGHSLIELLAGRQAELLAALEKLNGKAEMRLRITLAPGEDSRQFAATISDECRPLDTWFEVRQSATGHTVLDMAQLIVRDESDRYREILARYGTAISGPLSPVHFLPQILRRPMKAEGRTTRARHASASRTG